MSATMWRNSAKTRGALMSATMQRSNEQKRRRNNGKKTRLNATHGVDERVCRITRFAKKNTFDHSIGRPHSRRIVYYNNFIKMSATNRRNHAKKNNAPFVSASRGVAVIQQGSKHGRLEALGRGKIAANDERLDRAAAAAARLRDRHAPEQQP